VKLIRSSRQRPTPANGDKQLFPGGKERPDVANSSLLFSLFFIFFLFLYHGMVAQSVPLVAADVLTGS
jgi:hypothetical protein